MNLENSSFSTIMCIVNDTWPQTKTSQSPKIYQYAPSILSATCTILLFLNAQNARQLIEAILPDDLKGAAVELEVYFLGSDMLKLAYTSLVMINAFKIVYIYGLVMRRA